MEANKFWTDEEVRAQTMQNNHRLRCEYCSKNYPKLCKDAEEIVKPKQEGMG